MLLGGNRRFVLVIIMARRAARHRASDGVVMGVVPRDSARYCAADAALGKGRCGR